MFGIKVTFNRYDGAEILFKIKTKKMEVSQRQNQKKRMKEKNLYTLGYLVAFSMQTYLHGLRFQVQWNQTNKSK